MAFASAVVGLVGSVYSQNQQKKAAKKSRQSQERVNQTQIDAQEKQNAIQQKQADLKTQRARVKSIREARIARGRIAAYGANTGTTGSSGVLGSSGSINSQLGGNFDYGNQQRGLASEASANNLATSKAIGVENNIQARAQGDASTWGAVGGVASTIFSQAGGFNTIFNPPAQRPNPGFSYNG